MGGIAGAWNRDGRPMDPDVLSAMSAALAHRGPDGEAHRIDGAVGFACQHRWVTPEDRGVVQPLWTSDGSVMVVMDGRLDNREELRQALDLGRELSDADYALAAYRTFDAAFAERLNGDFAIAVFDAPKRRLIVVRDSIGARPIYYYESGALFAFATEIKSLLAHPDIPMEPDTEGLADYMFVGARPFVDPHRTSFRDICSVVPAQMVIAGATSLTRRQYWDFDTRRSLRLRTFEDYVEGFRERFAEAVRRRARSSHPVAVSTSGGLDSSSIFCQAETLRRSGAITTPKLAGVSYLSDQIATDERQYLCEIEKQYNVSIDRFLGDPLIGLVKGAQQQIGAIEAPFIDYMWGVTRCLHERAAAAGARTLLSGHWGDQVLFSSAYLTDLFNRGEWLSIWRHTREYINYFGKAETRILRRRLLRDAVRHDVPDRLVPPLKWLRLKLARPKTAPWFTSTFVSTGNRLRHRPAAFGLKFHSAHARSIYIEARSKYHVHCLEWNNKVGALFGLEPAFPFLDRDVVAFLMAIPGEMFAYQGVPRVLLREAMRGILPEAIRTRTWKSDFGSFVNTGVKQDTAEIVAALSRHALAVQFGFFDSDRLESEVARLASELDSENCENSWDLADSFGFEVWLRVFSKARRPPNAHVCA